MSRDTITGAADWASYLINGDSSGLEENEIEACNAWLEREGIKSVLTCGEEYFSWAYGMHTGTQSTGGMLVDYVVEIRARSSR